MAGRRRKLDDKDLAIKLTELALDGINLTWSAVVLSEPYHRVLRVAQEWQVPYATSVLTSEGVRVNRRKWTPEEDEVLRDLNLSPYQQAQKLNRTPKAVYQRRHILQKLQDQDA